MKLPLVPWALDAFCLAKRCLHIFSFLHDPSIAGKKSIAGYGGWRGCITWLSDGLSYKQCFFGQKIALQQDVNARSAEGPVSRAVEVRGVGWRKFAPVLHKMIFSSPCIPCQTLELANLRYDSLRLKKDFTRCLSFQGLKLECTQESVMLVLTGQKIVWVADKKFGIYFEGLP